MSRSRVYAPPPDAAPPPRQSPPSGPGSNQSLIMAIILIVLVAGGFALWNLYGAPPKEDVPVIEAEVQTFKEPFTGEAPDEPPPTVEIDQAIEKSKGEAAPKPAAPKAAPATAPPARGVEYVAQIASLQSEAAANAAWTRLSSKDPALFAGAKKDVQRADLGTKGVYFRVRAGYFPERSEASRFCERVKAGGQDCIVVVR